MHGASRPGARSESSVGDIGPAMGTSAPRPSGAAPDAASTRCASGRSGTWCGAARSTKRMPVSAARSSTRARPRYCSPLPASVNRCRGAAGQERRCRSDARPDHIRGRQAPQRRSAVCSSCGRKARSFLEPGEPSPEVCMRIRAEHHSHGFGQQPSVQTDTADITALIPRAQGTLLLALDTIVDIPEPEPKVGGPCPSRISRKDSRHGAIGTCGQQRPWFSAV